MGWKNTTYRREFSPLRRQVKQDYGATYGQFVDYRFQRRQQEHRHEPFQWGEWEWANGGSESSENEAAEELQHGQKWAYRYSTKRLCPLPQKVIPLHSKRLFILINLI